jgi:recombination protein RecA
MPVKLNRKKETSELAEEVKDSVAEDAIVVETKKVAWNEVKIVSTGSTLLDLAISGGRIKNGGIPGGVILEIAGPAGSGKTAILAAIAASAQSKGGQVMFLDPEARFDKQYAEIYGIKLEGADYHRPNTVEEVFEKVYEWKPSRNGVPNVIVTDSLAALSTEMEMDDKDAYGMRRAKCFSEGFRKTARIISNNDWIIACSNQQRDGQYGATTPGGQAIKYYCSLRISMKQVKKISKEKDFHGKKVSKELGIESECTIVKSSLDDPFRKCLVSIVFRKGIDTVRDELAFYKATMNETSYDCFDKKYQSLDKATEYIEQNQMQDQLKERTIILWNEVESLFTASKRS